MVFSVRRSLAWMFLSQGGMFVLQFGTSVVVSRLLTPYEMGVFAIAMAIVGLLSTIQALGLSGYVVRAVELKPGLLASVFTINAAIAVLLSAMIAGLGTLGGMLLAEAGVRRLLLILAVTPLINLFGFLPACGIERHGNFRAIALLNLARALIGNGVMLGFAFSGFSYMSLAYGQIAGSLVAVVGNNIIGRHHVSLRLSLVGWQEILRYGMQMLTISGVVLASSRLAEVLMGRLLGLGALGLYSRASSLNSLLWDNVHMVIARIVFVDFAEQKRQGRSLRDSYLRINQMMTALLWPAFAGLAVIAGPLVLTLYGKNWVDAALPLSLLSLSAIVLVSITMTWEVFVVCHETAKQARFEFVRAGVGLVLFAIGSTISLAGAAAARIGEALFAVTLYRPHLERMTNTCLKDFIPIYIHSGMLTAVAILPVTVVMAIYRWSADAPLPILAPAIVMGVAGWIIGLRMLHHPLFDEGRLILSRLRPSRQGEI